MESAAPGAAGEELDARCPELLLPAPARAAGATGSPPATSSDPEGAPPPAASREMLPAEASMPGEGAPGDGGEVEIFIQAVAGNVTLSTAPNAAGTMHGEGAAGWGWEQGGRGWLRVLGLQVAALGFFVPRTRRALRARGHAGAFPHAAPSPRAEVLVKVVELYFCESCGQSFPEASLLARHRCLPLPEHPQHPGVLPAPPSQLQGCEQGASTPQHPAADRLPCPVCQEAFVQPSELKEHFKSHRGPRGALPCPQKGCCFATEDRQQLRGHLRRLHGASPVSCAHRACPLLFPSRPAMEQHRRSHFPFHCARCDFVTANAKLFWQHRKGHGAEQHPRVLPAGTARSGGIPAGGCLVLQRGYLGLSPPKQEGRRKQRVASLAGEPQRKKTGQQNPPALRRGPWRSWRLEKARTAVGMSPWGRTARAPVRARTSRMARRLLRKPRCPRHSVSKVRPRWERFFFHTFCL